MSPSLRQGTWPRALLAAALVAALAVAVAPRLSPAQPPAPGAAPPTAASTSAGAGSTTGGASASGATSLSSTSSESASTSAVPSAPPAGPFPIDADESSLPAIDHTPYPVVPEKPVAPKPKEWLGATRVRFTRRGAGAPTCQMRRLREWLRVRCEGDFLAVGQIAGTAEGVTVWVHEPQTSLPNAAEITFPMRPGDRRIFQIFGFDTYGGPVPYPRGGPVLQAYWLEGAPAPVVLLR